MSRHRRRRLARLRRHGRRSDAMRVDAVRAYLIEMFKPNPCLRYFRGVEDRYFEAVAEVKGR